MTSKDEIIALCRQLGQAHADKNADAIIDCYAPDAVVYDMAPPLARRGLDKKSLKAWLNEWEGPIRIDSEGTVLTVENESAWTTGLNRMRGVKTGGETVDLWFRTSMCFRKTEGRWRIVHDHSSVPFYMDGSYRACVDLRPDSVNGK